MLWVIHAEDKPGSSELRQRTRPDHLAYVGRHPVVFGGPLLDDDGDMCGSMLAIDLPDRSAVEQFVAGDPYNQAGLFQRVSVHAWKQLVPAPSDGG